MPAETLNHPDLSFVREDGRDQRDAFVHEKWIVDQTFPCWNAAVQGSQSDQKSVVPGLKLTGCIKSAALADVGELLDPNTAGSMPTTRPLMSGESAAADAHRKRLPT